MGILNHSLLRTDFEHINPVTPRKSKPRNKPQHQLPVKRVHLEIRLPIYTYISISIYTVYILYILCVCLLLFFAMFVYHRVLYMMPPAPLFWIGPLSPQVGDDQDPPLAIVALGVLAQGGALRTSVGLYTQWPIECCRPCRLSIFHDILYIYIYIWYIYIYIWYIYIYIYIYIYTYITELPQTKIYSESSW